MEMTYTAPDGTSMSKSLTVVIDDTATAAAALPQGNSTSAYASTSAPPPPFTTGKITKIEYVVSTWLIWFNGVEAYCCSHGLNGQPNGCPTYNFAYVSKLEPGQYTPGNHYANQINIWGGLNQLSLGVLTEKHDSTTFSGSEFAANLPSLYSAAGTDTLGKAYQYYDDTQLWIIEHYPDWTKSSRRSKTVSFTLIAILKNAVLAAPRSRGTISSYRLPSGTPGQQYGKK